MSFAMMGITHCSICGNTLTMNEIGKCKNCQEEYQKKQNEIKLNTAIELKIKLELEK